MRFLRGELPQVSIPASQQVEPDTTQEDACLEIPPLWVDSLAQQAASQLIIV